MKETNLKDSFDHAEGEASLATGDMSAHASQAEAVAFNLHSALTSMMTVNPSAAAGALTTAGQLIYLLSSAEQVQQPDVPHDRLRARFKMSVDNVRTASADAITNTANWDFKPDPSLTA